MYISFKRQPQGEAGTTPPQLLPITSILIFNICLRVVVWLRIIVWIRILFLDLNLILNTLNFNNPCPPLFFDFFIDFIARCVT